MQIYFVLDYQKTLQALRAYYAAYNEDLKSVDPVNYKNSTLKICTLATAQAIFTAFGGALQGNRIHNLSPKKSMTVNVTGIASALGRHRCTVSRHLDQLFESGILLLRRNLGNHTGVEIIFNPKLIVLRTPIENSEYEKLQQVIASDPQFNFQEFVKSISYENYPTGAVEFSKITTSLTLKKAYVANRASLEIPLKNNINTESKKDFPVDKIEGIDLDSVPDFLRSSVERAIENEKSTPSENQYFSSSKNYGQGMSGFLNNFSGGAAQKNITSSSGVANTNSTLACSNIENNYITTTSDISNVLILDAGDDPALQAAIDRFTSAAWNFARKTLYPDTEFEGWQIQVTFKRIREYFALIPRDKWDKNVVRYLNEFIQRVLLARNFVEKKPERYIPVPWKYFSKDFEQGFKGTRSWLEKVDENRARTRHKYDGIKLVSNLYSRCVANPELIDKAREILYKKKNERNRELFESIVVLGMDNDTKQLFKNELTLKF